jgi:prolyl-tRNA synthetase
LNSEHEENRKLGFDLYEKLSKTYDVLMDDRNVAAGMQFADADLLGIPVRIIVSKRNLEKGELELVTRDKTMKKNIKLENVERELGEIIHI